MLLYLLMHGVICSHSCIHHDSIHWDPVWIQSGKLISWNKPLSQSILCPWMHGAQRRKTWQTTFSCPGNSCVRQRRFLNCCLSWYINKPHRWKSLNPNLLIPSAFPEGFCLVKTALQIISWWMLFTSQGWYCGYYISMEAGLCTSWSHQTPFLQLNHYTPSSLIFTASYSPALPQSIFRSAPTTQN